MSSLSILKPRDGVLPVDTFVALARELTSGPPPTTPTLHVGVFEDEAIVLGAFQRATEISHAEARLVRRASGGGAVCVGRGTVWVALDLPIAAALIHDASIDKVLNRYVRPLLRAVTRASGSPARYFGRDWISVAGRPVGVVAWSHEAATDRVTFEAFVAVSTPLAVGERATFMEKAPATLREVAPRADEQRLLDEIADAYAELASSVVDGTLEPRDAALDSAPSLDPWLATREEAIGLVACGRDPRGQLVIGGELMASRDALARLGDTLASLGPAPSSEEVSAALHDALALGGAYVFGVRSLTSLREVILEALAHPNVA